MYECHERRNREDVILVLLPRGYCEAPKFWVPCKLRSPRSYPVEVEDDGYTFYYF